MRFSPANSHHARAIADLYRQAFPASVALFWTKKSSSDLLDLLELSFKFAFYWGAQGVLALNDENQLVGYLLYNPATKKRQPGKALAIFPRMVGKIALSELKQLTHNQLLMSTSIKRTKKVPKPRAQILSLAVSPACQGQGVGTLLLNNAMVELQNQFVCLNVRANNPAAQKLYSKTGFYQYGTTRDLAGKWFMLVRQP